VHETGFDQVVAVEEPQHVRVAARLERGGVLGVVPYRVRDASRLGVGSAVADDQLAAGYERVAEHSDQAGRPRNARLARRVARPGGHRERKSSAAARSAGKWCDPPSR
jgi:hypothetical protein